MANEQKKKAAGAPPKPLLQQVVAALPAAFDKTVKGYNEGVNDAYKEFKKPGGGHGATALAVLPVAKAARGFGQDVIGDPVMQLVRYLGSGSGGELPPAQETKAAPKAAPAITTRPKSAQNVYEELNRRLGEAILGGGEASVDLLQAFSQTVPAAGKPVPAKDQLMLTAAGLLEEGAAQRILAARQSGDVNGVRSARDDYVRRIAALIGGDPYSLIGEEEDD